MRMFTILSRRGIVTASALVFAVAASQTARANIQLIWEIDGVEVHNVVLSGGIIFGSFESYATPPGFPVVDGGTSSELNYTISADADPFNIFNSTAMVAGNFALTNTDTVGHHYTVTVLVNLTTALAASLFDAQASGSLVTPGGGTFTTVGFGGYKALMDGSNVLMDWQNLTETHNPPNPPPVFPQVDASGNGNPFPPTVPGLPVAQIGFQFDFDLTGNSSTANFASQVTATIPSPGSLALLAVAGLVVAKRRRRQ